MRHSIYRQKLHSDLEQDQRKNLHGIQNPPDLYSGVLK